MHKIIPVNYNRYRYFYTVAETMSKHSLYLQSSILLPAVPAVLTSNYAFHAHIPCSMIPLLIELHQSIIK